MDSIFHILEIELPNWVGPRQWTWDKLDRLTTFIANQQITRPYWLIAITEWVSTDVKAQLAARYQITPSTKSENWKCLGFDVSDAYLLSGLMNCGYTSEERQPLRDIWGNKLNPYHLFDRIEEAQAFRVMTDKRVAEHQPFSVYGLYLIKAS